MDPLIKKPDLLLEEASRENMEILTTQKEPISVIGYSFASHKEK